MITGLTNIIEDSKIEVPTKELKKKLNLVIDNLTADLYHISKEESRMNKKNSTDISKEIIFWIFIYSNYLGQLNKVAVSK